MIDEQEIELLINLLDDPDKEVYELIKNKLCKLGLPVVKHLEKAWENSLDDLFQTRIENITKDIQFEHVKSELNLWVKNDENNLLKGVLIISKYQYPDLDTEVLNKKIKTIQNDIWLEINNQLTALEKTRIINHILFEIHGFARSSSFQSSAQYFFINHLIDTKKGSPISLAILYAIIAQNLDLPIYGVALPKNFILCYKDVASLPFSNQDDNDVLFYINPFNKGVVFGKKEVLQFIKQQKLENKAVYFKPCENKQTLIELLQTLISFYKKNNDETKVKDYETLLNILYF